MGRFLLLVGSLLLVMLIFSSTSDGPPGWGPADWEAAATAVTAIVALVAVAVAIYQLHDARELRWAQAQPYVAAYLEPDTMDPKIAYLVIRNFGTTAASDLSIRVEPKPIKSKGVGGGPLLYPPSMPLLMPAQEWRTLWDFGPFRLKDQDVATEHVVTLTYKDARSISHTNVCVLDWESFTTGRTWIGRNSIHSIGQDLRSMDRHLARIADVLGDGDDRLPASDAVMSLVDHEDDTPPPKE